jgi:hypothetical protein
MRCFILISEMRKGNSENKKLASFEWEGSVALRTDAHTVGF